MRRLSLLILVATLAAASLWAQPELQFVDLGSCALESGQVVEDCRLAYRTFGELNAEGSNAVLFPTWFSGRTQEVEPYVGPNRMVDTANHFVIAVGALGNGLSSSPSTSRTQAGAAFPRVTIADMVTQQHRLVTELLGLKRLKAVVGISMGGMQTFEWAVAYPKFIERAVSITGSPRLGSYDALLWRAELNAIDRALATQVSPRKGRVAAMRAVAELHELALRTPAGVNRAYRADEVSGVIAKKASELILRSDPYDWATQLRAMIDHDIGRRVGGLEAAAGQVKARMLVVVSAADHMVTPQSALAFAESTKSETLRIEGDCGHLIFECDGGQVTQRVKRFLRESK